jgi:hypothetical protein
MRIDCRTPDLNKVSVSSIGAANGVAPLDAGAEVPQANSFLPVPSLATGNVIGTEYLASTRARIVAINIDLSGMRPTYDYHRTMLTIL